MRLSKHQLAVVAITLCTIIWSVAPPVFKWSLQQIHPFTLVFLRFLIATIIILPIVKTKIKIKFEDFYKLFILALIGLTFNISFVYLGLTLSQSINAPIFSSLVPILMLISGLIFLHEVPKKKEVFGTFISLIGILILILRPIDHLPLKNFIIGDIYLILSNVSLVCYTLLFKKFKLKYPPATLLFWIFFIATVTSFPKFIFEIKSYPLSTIGFQGAIGIMYGAILSSVVGQALYNYAVNHLKTDEIGIFIYLGPVVTALVALPLLHEQLTFAYLLGSLFVFLGLIVAEAKLHYHLHPHVPNPSLESDP